MESFEAKDKQVWMKFDRVHEAGNYPIAVCYTPELAKRIADAMNKEVMKTTKALLQKYNELEDRNDHTGAAKLLIDTFGTETEQEIMNAIATRHQIAGHIEHEDYKKRYEISQKYYKLLRNL